MSVPSNVNTWYGRLIKPCPAGTLTLQEAPSFAWRTCDKTPPRVFPRLPQLFSLALRVFPRADLKKQGLRCFTAPLQGLVFVFIPKPRAAEPHPKGRGRKGHMGRRGRKERRNLARETRFARIVIPGRCPGLAWIRPLAFQTDGVPITSNCTRAPLLRARIPIATSRIRPNCSPDADATATGH